MLTRWSCLIPLHSIAILDTKDTAMQRFGPHRVHAQLYPVLATRSGFPPPASAFTDFVSPDGQTRHCIPVLQRGEGDEAYRNKGACG
jgi:hypothetical protein